MLYARNASRTLKRPALRAWRVFRSWFMTRWQTYWSMWKSPLQGFQRICSRPTNTHTTESRSCWGVCRINRRQFEKYAWSIVANKQSQSGKYQICCSGSLLSRVRKMSTYQVAGQDLLTTLTTHRRRRYQQTCCIRNDVWEELEASRRHLRWFLHQSPGLFTDVVEF